MAGGWKTAERLRGFVSQLNGGGWNRFWFTPVDPLPTSVLRILTGLLAIWFLGGYCLDLAHWLAEDGMLPSDLVYRLTGAYVAGESGVFLARPTYLHFAREPAVLWAFHLGGLAVAVLYTLGFASRWTNIATLIAVLSYVHRAPMLSGQFEPVLCLLLFYLCLAPTGAYFSADRWLRRRRGGDTAPRPCWTANTSLRLIQLHVAALYLLMGLTKLAGAPWWNGEAVWWLVAHTESRLIDLTWLHHSPYLFNALTHAVIVIELGFPLLVLSQWSRPVAVLLSALMWIGLGLLTGLFSFSAAMLVANAAFISADLLRDVCSDLKLLKSPAASGAGAVAG